MNISDLEDEIEDLEDAIDDINAQLGIREAEECTDKVWFAKARAALRYKNRDLSRAKLELGEARKIERAKAHFYYMFHMQARKLVDDETFAKIEAKAEKVINDASQ